MVISHRSFPKEVINPNPSFTPQFPTQGLMGPPKMSPLLVQKINDDVNKVMALPEVLTMLDGLSAAGGGGSPKKFADFIDDELVRWEKVVREAKITV